MKVLVVCFFLLSLFLVVSNARISFNFDTGDLDDIVDFAQPLILHNQMQRLRRQPQASRVSLLLISFLSKFGNWICQTISLMFGMTGASILSSKWESYDSTPQQSQQQQEKQQSELFFKTISNDADDALNSCQTDFGCNNNLCWRTCNAVSISHVHEKKMQWCYTSPSPNSRKLKQCEYSTDCSRCWECIEPCHDWYKLDFSSFQS